MADAGRGGHADVRGDDMASSTAPFYPAAIVRCIDWWDNADDGGYQTERITSGEGRILVRGGGLEPPRP